MLKFRIVQKEYADGGITYVLEKQENDGEWVSTYAHRDLEVIREAKMNRENRGVVAQKVIE